MVQWLPGSAYRVHHGSAAVEIDFTLFLGGALVELLLTLGQRDSTLYQVAFPVHLGANDRIAFLLGAGKKLCQLMLVQQEFAGAGRVGDGVAADGWQGGDMGTQQEGLTIFDDHVAVQQLDFLLAQAFHFPATQLNAGLDVITQEKIVTGLFIDGDGVVVTFLFFCFAHGATL